MPKPISSGRWEVVVPPPSKFTPVAGQFEDDAEACSKAIEDDIIRKR